MSHRKSGRKSPSKRKGSYRRIKKSIKNPCSLRQKNICTEDPNCHYVKRRGCMRKSGVVKGSAVYEGPKIPIFVSRKRLARKSKRLARKSKRSQRKSKRSQRK